LFFEFAGPVSTRLPSRHSRRKKTRPHAISDEIVERVARKKRKLDELGSSEDEDDRLVADSPDELLSDFEPLNDEIDLGSDLKNDEDDLFEDRALAASPQKRKLRSPAPRQNPKAKKETSKCAHKLEEQCCSDTIRTQLLREYFDFVSNTSREEEDIRRNATRRSALQHPRSQPVDLDSRSQFHLTQTWHVARLHFEWSLDIKDHRNPRQHVHRVQVASIPNRCSPSFGR
jgi:hypothetical protein